MKYTDTELLELLEENGYEPTYRNLLIFKENLENGNITIEETKAEEKSVEEKVPTEEPAISTNITVTPDGEATITNGNKTVIADASGNVSMSLTERLSSKNTERLLKSFLTEDCAMSLNEFEILKEETKVESVKTMAVELLKSIEEKLNSIDTSPADKSRGDIKALRELPALQDSITKLESLIEREQTAKPEYAEAIRIIIRSILYINQNSAAFKDAYRNKKTLMILRYQSLIMSIISSVSFLIACIVSFENGEVHIKKTDEDILSFSSLKALEAFNKSVESGEFKIVSRDVNTLREFYLEVPMEKMSTILEGYEYIPMIIDSIKNIYTQATTGSSGNKLTNLLFKVAGVIVLIFSLRDAFYTMFRMKTKVSDMIGAISNFANINSGFGGITTQLLKFAGKFKTDASFSSDMAKREIEDENQKLLGQVRQIESTPEVFSNAHEPQELPVVKEPKPINTDDFNLDF